LLVGWALGAVASKAVIPCNNIVGVDEPSGFALGHFLLPLEAKALAGGFVIGAWGAAGGEEVENVGVIGVWDPAEFGVANQGAGCQFYRLILANGEGVVEAIDVDRIIAGIGFIELEGLGSTAKGQG